MRMIGLSTTSLKIFLFIILVQFIFFPVASATDVSINYQQISTKEGLSNSKVTCILQDREGFLWFGTFNGLNRFDGYEFKIFRHIPNDSSSLSDNYVTTLYEDKTGDIWVGTKWGGLCRFNKQKETFTNYSFSPLNKNGLSSNYVTSVCEDTDGQIWIATLGGGIDIFDKGKDTFKHLEYSKTAGSINGNYVLALYADKSGAMWVGTRDSSLCKIVKEKSRLRVLNFKQKLGNFAKNTISGFASAGSAKLWVATSNGLCLMDTKTDKCSYVDMDPKLTNNIPNNRIETVFVDKSGMIWIGSQLGLLKYNPPVDKFQPFIINKTINDINFSCIYEDKSGVIWIGTTGQGIFKWHHESEAFSFLGNRPGGAGSLISGEVRRILEDSKGILWIGTNDGICRLDRNTNRFVNYPAHGDGKASFKVREIIETNSGEILVCADAKGMFRWNNSQNRLEKIILPPNNEGKTPRFIRSAAKDKAGTLWLASELGLLEFDGRQKCTYKEISFIEPGGLAKNYTPSVLYIDSEGIVWIGTDYGLIKFLPDKGSFSLFHHEPDNPNSLSHSHILSVSEDMSGNLWIGTREGFNKYDKKTNKFTAYNIKGELQGSSYFGIYNDNKGTLWISTAIGLYAFNPETGIVKKYRDDNFVIGAHFKSRRGELFFGSREGFVSIFPDSIHANNFVPPIVITDLKVFNQSRHFESSLNSLDVIKLSHKDLFFSIEFAALNYVNPEKNQYAYKLEGINDNWVQLGNKHNVAFNNLPPGKYTLRLIGSNNDNKWNMEGKTIKIIIAPPFYKTILFKILMVALMLLGVFMIHRRRIKNLEVYNTKLEQEVNNKTSDIKKANAMLEEKNQQLHNSMDTLVQKNEEIRQALENERKLRSENKELESINLMLKNELQSEKINIEGVIGKSPAIKEIKNKIAIVSETDSTVLLLGETGTGKTLLAKAIHNLDKKRSCNSFIMINCANIPRELLEGELFGYEKGAYTGAYQTKPGKVELADNGTLFLDEIGDIDYNLQSKLLTFIQDGTFYRVGSNKLRKVNARIIAATNKDLEQAIEEKVFRKDLYYRLNVFPIYNPPLRERIEDIPELVSSLVLKFNIKFRKDVEKISNESLKSLMNYSWPGNIRELENIIERAFILGAITSGVLYIQPIAVNTTTAVNNTSSSGSLAEQIAKISDVKDIMPLDDLAKVYIKHVIKLVKGKISGENGAAELLKIERHNLQRRMKKFEEES